MKQSIVTHIDRLLDDIAQHVDLSACYKRHEGYFTCTIEPPKHAKTLQQIRTFHALIHAIYATGETSYDCEEDLKQDMKLRCMPAVGYIYLDGIMQKYVKRLDDVPTGSYFVAIPGSMADATIEQATKGIEELLTLIREAGISSRKIDEIIAGMQDDE